MYMYLVDLGNAFDRVPEWAVRNRGIPEVMVRAVMSFYEGAKTRDKNGLELSVQFEVTVFVHQGSVLSPMVFATVVYVVRKSVRNSFMSEMMDGLSKKL